MAIKYLAGDRLIGTAAERTALSGNTLTAVPQTSWKELDRITLGSSSAEVEVTGLTAKDNLMILVYSIGSNTNDAFISFNGDEGSNYANRYSRNGGSDSTDTSQGIGLRYEQGATTPQFAVITVRNIASKEKLVIGHTVTQNSAGAGNVPTRQEWVGKWANTSNAITQVTLDRASGTFDSGTELIVLGCDDDEADSGTNFWQEIASEQLDDASDTLDSGTITNPKKYLMVQTFIKAVTATAEPDMRFNNVAGSEYADRYNINGGTDGSATGITSIRGSGVPYSVFFNDFIINTSANEKLVIRETNYPPSSGAGTAPSRRETVGKWANTLNQITSIKWVENSGGVGQFDTGSIMKVWGSD